MCLHSLPHIVSSSSLTLIHPFAVSFFSSVVSLYTLSHLTLNHTSLVFHVFSQFHPSQGYKPVPFSISSSPPPTLFYFSHSFLCHLISLSIMSSLLSLPVLHCSFVPIQIHLRLLLFSVSRHSAIYSLFPLSSPPFPTPPPSPCNYTGALSFMVSTHHKSATRATSAKASSLK